MPVNVAEKIFNLKIPQRVKKIILQFAFEKYFIKILMFNKKLLVNFLK